MIKAIITDFDGTLVDTFEANYCAYNAVLTNLGIHLSREEYRECFGLRFDAFMASIGIFDDELCNKIKESKANVYPTYFEKLVPNKSLIEFLSSMRLSGIKVAIASTARKENLINVLKHIGAVDLFDLILTGVNVTKSKPDPEIYNLAMQQLGVEPHDVLIFEDSEVGLQAAKASGAQYIKVVL